MAKVDLTSPSLIVAHTRDEGFDSPVVFGELALDPRDDGIHTVLTLNAVHGTQADAPALEREQRLKKLIVRTMLPGFQTSIRWSPDAPATNPPKDHAYQPTHHPRGVQVAARLDRARMIGRLPFAQEGS